MFSLRHGIKLPLYLLMLKSYTKFALADHRRRLELKHALTVG